MLPRSTPGRPPKFEVACAAVLVVLIPPCRRSRDASWARQGPDAVSSPSGAMSLRLTSEVIVILDGSCSPWVLLLPLDCCW